MKRSERQEERDAYHEAGHAVVTVFLGLRLHAISIKRDDAHSTHRATKRDDMYWLRNATIAYGGAEAERRLCGPRSRWRAGAGDDLWRAYHALEEITVDPPSLRALQTYAMRQARLLVERHWPEIEALARLLLERKTVTGKEATKLVQERWGRRGETR